MRKLCKIYTTLIFILILTSAIIAQERSGRIYGKVTKVTGDIYEGRIIWGSGNSEHETI